jgi:negative regulator of sigma E activity
MSTIDADTLEAALTGAPGAEPELSALVRDVRAQAPAMEPRFAARLDEQVAALPSGRRAARPRGAPAWRRPRRLLPALAVTAVLLVVTAVALTRYSGSEDLSATFDGPTTQTTKRAPQDNSTSSAGSSAAPARRTTPASPRLFRRSARPSSAGALGVPARLRGLSADLAASAARPRRVQRDADLTLTTAPREVQDVADRVVSVTQDIGGVVARSSVDVGDAQAAASFTLRIPTSRLDDGLKRLSDLAHVGSLRQGSTDITGSFVSAADRLSDARAERRALLKALGKATTPNAIASLRSRIRFNRSEIAALKGDLQALRRRADLATVSVQVVGRGATKGAMGGDGGWTPGDAAHDALRVLEVLAGVLLIAVAVLAPLGVLALLMVLATGAARRRRREHALDAA